MKARLAHVSSTWDFRRVFFQHLALVVLRGTLIRLVGIAVALPIQRVADFGLSLDVTRFRSLGRARHEVERLPLRDGRQAIVLEIQRRAIADLEWWYPTPPAATDPWCQAAISDDALLPSAASKPPHRLHA